VNTFLDAVVAGLDGNKEKISQAIDDLAVVAASLGERDAAIGRLVENVNTVVGAVDELLTRPDVYAGMARATNPFGDGHASARIVSALKARLFEHALHPRELEVSP